MPKVKVTYNAKPKRTENIDIDNYEHLLLSIYNIFKIEQGQIKFMKPRLKVHFTPFRTKIPSLRK
jgi:hypothetical protein